MKIRLLDGDIRKILIERIRSRLGETTEAVILEELGMSRNSAIIDIAVISDESHGFEIKGTEDTLSRLPSQIKVYGENFKRITVVVASKHLESAMNMVPTWMGIVEATSLKGKVRLRRKRRDGINPDFNVLKVANLLWRSELLAILQSLGQDRGIAGKNRQWLCDCLQMKFSSEKLHRLVRLCLLKRVGWKPGKIAIGVNPQVNFELEFIKFCMFEGVRRMPTFQAIPPQTPVHKQSPIPFSSNKWKGPASI